MWIGAGRLTLASIAALAVLTGSRVVYGQTVVDATTAEFTPSSDHTKVSEDGTPLLTRYVLDILRVGSPTPWLSIDLGKPVPDADGVIRVPFASLLPTPLVGGDNYQARVSAVGPGGSSASELSNMFASSAPCAPVLSAVSVSLGSAASTGSITVTAGAACGWTAVADASWLTITSAMPATGSSPVAFAATANTATSGRSGTLTIAGQTVTVTQVGASACTYAINPTNRTEQATGTTSTVAVTTASGCAWTATSAAPWLTVTAGASGTGNGSVSVNVAANSATTQRTGSVSIAGQTYSVTQLGACAFTVTPANVSASAAGTTGSFSIGTTSSCTWSASGIPAWITMSSATRTGSGSLSYTVPANTGAARTVTLTIAGQAVAVSQAAGSSCTYSINPASRTVEAPGETSNVAVTAAIGCAWTASSSASWLTVTAGASGSGTGSVSVRVAANGATSQRTGSVNIAGRTYSVTQRGTCSFSVTPGSVSASAAGTTSSFSVSTTSACTWSASGIPTWITMSSSTRTGSGSVSYTIPANPGVARSATLTIAGSSIVINQSAASLLPPENFRILKGGGDQ